MKYLTLKEVADILRLRVETLYYWIDQRKYFDMKAIKKTPNGRYLIPEMEVKRLIKSVD